jgi:hypothetical protein
VLEELSGEEVSFSAMQQDRPSLAQRDAPDEGIFFPRAMKRLAATDPARQISTLVLKAQSPLGFADSESLAIQDSHHSAHEYQHTVDQAVYSDDEGSIYHRQSGAFILIPHPVPQARSAQIIFADYLTVGPSDSHDPRV